MSAQEPVEAVDSQGWERVSESELPVLVEFWAPWCGPCHVMAPMIGSLAQELESKVKFVKVNVDESPDIASKFQVFSVPTFLLLEKGAVKERFVGMATRERMAKMAAGGR